MSDTHFFSPMAAVIPQSLAVHIALGNMNKDETSPPKSRMHEHIEKMVYMILGGVITFAINVAKDKLLDTPDFALQASICAPVTNMTAKLVNINTGKEYPIENPAHPNPVEVSFRNVGKKPLENIEFVLEFTANGEVDLQNQRYATKPPVGFGRVTFVDETPKKKRIQIALLNPKDEFSYFADAVRPTTIAAYSKAPGISFYQLQGPGCSTW